MLNPDWHTNVAQQICVLCLISTSKFSICNGIMGMKNMYRKRTSSDLIETYFNHIPWTYCTDTAKWLWSTRTLSSGISTFCRTCFTISLTESFCNVTTSPMVMDTAKENEIWCYTVTAYQHKTWLTTFLCCLHKMNCYVRLLLHSKTAGLHNFVVLQQFMKWNCIIKLY